VALRILRNPLDAEEVTLDVFLQVWRRAASFDPRRGSVATWLVLMARCRAIDRLRSLSARLKHEEPGSAENLNLACGMASPEKAAAGGERQRRLAEALAVLTAEQRQVIELAFFAGLTHTEVAARLRQPIGTVKTRIRLGMMKLRAAFEARALESAVT